MKGAISNLPFRVQVKPEVQFIKKSTSFPKIVLRCVLSLSYGIDLRSAKIILRFSQVILRKRSKQILNFVISFVIVCILRHQFCGPKFFLGFILFQFCLKFVLRLS